jgi:hypothetical protein
MIFEEYQKKLFTENVRHIFVKYGRQFLLIFLNAFKTQLLQTFAWKFGEY